MPLAEMYEIETTVGRTLRRWIGRVLGLLGMAAGAYLIWSQK